ncbi:MAG TPA: SOS response-associated peptidase, partial [Firmicutes bacterium]|nr:SOS response-associated peptidase [Bacillota bacterium]
EQNWLCPALSTEEILSLTRPLDDSLMEAHTISRLITSKTEQRNVPAIQNEFRYPELTEL